MISIKIPKENEFINEINYIIKIMFKDFMKIDYQIDYHEFPNYSIIVSLSKKIVVEFDKIGYEKEINNVPKKIFFQTKKDNQFIIENDIPIIFGKNSPVEIVEKNEETIIYCPIDIFASSFFMLTRWEEYFNPIKDKHGRFPGEESTAYKNNFLHRPVVNEYVEMLWNMLEFLGLNQKRVKSNYKINITCDIDHPFDMSVYLLIPLVKRFGAEIILRHNLQKAFKTIKNFYSKYDDYITNIYNIMDLNEKYNNIVKFYFIPIKTCNKDQNINFHLPKFKKILREINERGHEIGIHPGYKSYNNDKLFKNSTDSFFSILSELNIKQNIYGGRQHFLRWDFSKTPILWENNGFDYDSSLSYADISGFRCGTCTEFNMYDFINKKQLKIKEIPLINMECSIISQSYEGLGYTQKALERFLYFKNICKKYGGTYTLLWHNSFFVNEKDYNFYEELIKN